VALSVELAEERPKPAKGIEVFFQEFPNPQVGIPSFRVGFDDALQLSDGLRIISAARCLDKGRVGSRRG